MRASTLATLLLVTTFPWTLSPGLTTVSLICTSRICGAASGGSCGTFFGGGGKSAALFAPDCGAADGVTTGAVEAAAGVETGDAGEVGVGRACACGGDGIGDLAPCAAWLHPASATTEAAIQTAWRTLRIIIRAPRVVLPALR
jgi:hypothetical protein